MPDSGVYLDSATANVKVSERRLCPEAARGMLRNNHGHTKLQNGTGAVPLGLVVSSTTLRRHLLHFAVLLLVSSVAIMEGVLILDGFLKENRVYSTCVIESGFDNPLGGRTLRRCSVMQRGGTTRCKLADVSLRRDPLPVRIYQQYHNTTLYPYLYDGTSELYRGLAQAPDIMRPDMDDVDATVHLELLHDSLYQNQLCEYSGFFALLAGGFVSSQPEPYVGFQSWKAKFKYMALECRDEAALVSAVEESINKGQDAFFFWACPRGPRGQKRKPDVVTRLYWGCEKAHKSCLDVFRTGFSFLFGSNPPAGLHDGLPPMPDDGLEWSYMSYFAMPKHQFERYLRFAALFFSVLDDHYYSSISHGKCPHYTATFTDEYQGQHCFCFVMERLVNIWAYHTGLPMMYLDLDTGNVQEVHAPRTNHSSPSLRAWFADANIHTLKFDVATHLARRNGRRLVERLLPRDFAFAEDGLNVLKYTVRNELSRRKGKEAVQQVLEEVAVESRAVS